jgi:hypothetical protein
MNIAFQTHRTIAKARRPTRFHLHLFLSNEQILDMNSVSPPKRFLGWCDGFIPATSFAMVFAILAFFAVGNTIQATKVAEPKAIRAWSSETRPLCFCASVVITFTRTLLSQADAFGLGSEFDVLR